MAIILLHNEPGQGTTVKIFLPAHIKNIDGKGRAVAREGNLYGTEAILLTEDEERVREITAMMLKRYGYSVLEAGNDEEALRLFRVADKPVNLLLTDMIMPGMNGLELTMSLRETTPELKVLCMSGYTDNALFEGVRKGGCPFINKPFTPKTLIGKIREILDAQIF